MASMLPDDELKRLRWRATHRGTREADMLVSAFFEAHHDEWTADERATFAEMLEEQDVDILAWAHGTASPPTRFEGPMMDALKRLDYLRVPK
jgi:antitoxin CptB